MDREKVIKDIEKQMSEPANEYVVLWFSEAEYVLELLKKQQKKARPRPERLLPCKCGCKRREHWYEINERSEILKCYKCGFEVAGKNEIDVHSKWNKAVTD